MTTSMKFCANCKFSSKSGGVYYCEHPNNGINIVSGEIKEQFASVVRHSEVRCGVFGKWYEQKPNLKLDYKPSLFMRIIKGILG